MSLQTLMKLAGHSRIVMTIYYSKICAAVMTETMQKAQEQMAARANSQVDRVAQRTLIRDVPTCVVGDEDGMMAAIPSDPEERTSAGFLRVLGGWCLAGGNTVSGEGCLAGCWNGGKCKKGVVHSLGKEYTAPSNLDIVLRAVVAGLSVARNIFLKSRPGWIYCSLTLLTSKFVSIKLRILWRCFRLKNASPSKTIFPLLDRRSLTGQQPA